jgi:protein-tyrosine-phosphatase
VGSVRTSILRRPRRLSPHRRADHGEVRSYTLDWEEPEEGIDIASNDPKLLTVDTVRESDVVITMGCGDACPIFPGKRYEDWQLDDPAGQSIDAVRSIRDEIRSRVETLIAELLPTWRPA